MSKIHWRIWKYKSLVFKSKNNWGNLENYKIVHDALGVKKMYDLILKEIYGKYETKHVTKE